MTDVNVFDSRYSLEKLQARANDIRKRAVGERVFLRGLIEFSNYCRCNCLYCGLRKDNNTIERYRLSDEEILAAARSAAESGVDTIVLQSGEDNFYSPGHIAALVTKIKDATGLAVTLSIGNHPVASYRLWKQAGADRYLIKHETADAKLYARLHPGDSLKNRLSALYALKNLGYELGTGFIVGLPDETPERLYKNIELTKMLEASMCGAGPFIPQKSTPLGTLPTGKTDVALKVIACLRCEMPKLNIPVTTALASLIPKNGHEIALRSGANVIMPNFTPPLQRKKYCIYDGKMSVEIDMAKAAISKARIAMQMEC